MAASMIYLGLVLFAGVASAQHGRIIGGNSIPIQNYPSVVQVENLVHGVMWHHSCAGSILTSLFILSAAHCFSGGSYAPDNRRVRAGSAAFESGGIIVHVSQAYNHPSFGQNGNDGDMSVVRLSSAFIFSDSLNVASIISGNSAVPVGWNVHKVGWGRVALNSIDRAPELQEAIVPVVDHTQCRERYASLDSRPVVTSNMFCTSSEQADSCDGDNGGPVFLHTSEGVPFVVGVISWGNGCLQPGFPGVNTAVSSYTNWILDVIAANQ